MNTPFKLLVLTPTGKFFDEKAVSVIAPSYDGYLGILAYHAPMIAAMVPGVLTVQSEDRTLVYATGPGVIDVTPDGVQILSGRMTAATDAKDALQKAKELAKA